MNLDTLKEALGDERLAAFLQAFDPGANMPKRQRLRLLEFARNGYHGEDPTLRRTDQWLMEQSLRTHRQVHELRGEVRNAMEKMTAPPHIPATYLGRLEDRAWVAIESRGQRVVPAGNISLDGLQPGDGVCLSHELNFVVSKMPSSPSGHIGRFQHAAMGKAVIKHRSEDVLCSTVNGLALEELRRGDAVLIDPALRLAYNKVDSEERHLPFEVEKIEDLTRLDIAGLDPEVELVLGTLSINLQPDLAGRYGIGGLTSILLNGPPGNGKTRLARVAASTLQKESNCDLRWIHLKPAGWKSKYVGDTEKAIRDTFEAIRKVSNSAEGNQHVIVFMDEVESFGRPRGSSGTHAYLDDFTNVLLAELDGFQSLQNVSLIAATNRKDLIDPALRERIGAIDVAVPRPKLAAAKAILRIHLDAGAPWAGDSEREEAIDAAAALIFLGDANQLCKLTFNDSSTRTVSAPELLSGRVLAAIATNSRRFAARREAESRGASRGITVNDVIEATEQAMDGLRTCITRENARTYLDDLKQDLAVVSVDPLFPKPRRTHPYFNITTP